jgi:predicted NUDIX family NTP pyrophosphohydrolase
MVAIFPTALKWSGTNGRLRRFLDVDHGGWNGFEIARTRTADYYRGWPSGMANASSRRKH